MIEVRIDTSELRELYALIGRNIVGTPSEPAGRLPSSPNTAAIAASPAAGGSLQEAAEPSPPLASEEPAPDRSLVLQSPIFTLVGLRPPASRPVPVFAVPPAATESDAQDQTWPGASARPNAVLGQDRVRHASVGSADAFAIANTGGRDAASKGSELRASAETRAPLVAGGNGTFQPPTEGALPSAANAPSSLTLRSDAVAGILPSLSSTGPVEGTDGSTTRRPASNEARGADRDWAHTSSPDALTPNARADAIEAAPNAPSLAQEVEAFLQSAGWADGPTAGQPERAGVIASFILNAAMIPGWPPPRPIEPAAFSRQIALPAAGAALASDEMEAGWLLLKALRDPSVVAALLAALATQRRRRRILAILALLTTNLRALLSLWAAEIAALPPMAERSAATRDRVALR